MNPSSGYASNLPVSFTLSQYNLLGEIVRIGSAAAKA